MNRFAQSPAIVALGATLLFPCSALIAAPTIEKLVINPPAVENWIIAPASGIKNQTNVTITFEATDPEALCANGGFIAGWKVNGVCTSSDVAPLPKWASLNRAGTSACLNPPRWPVTTARFNQHIEVTPRAKEATWSLCASNTVSQQTTSQEFRVSYGPPVKSVNIAKANYSLSTGLLQIQGSVTPKADTKLTGSIVHILDGIGSEIGTSTVEGRKFTAQLAVASKPEAIKVRVVTTTSKINRVKPVK